MEIYKKGQAGIYRRITAAIILLLAVYAAFCWARWNGYKSEENELLNQILQWGGVGVLILAGALAGFFLGFINQKSSDYIIATDEEMRKVTWPNKDELVSSSIIVIIVMVILGLITAIFDLGFVNVLKLLSSAQG